MSREDEQLEISERLHEKLLSNAYVPGKPLSIDIRNPKGKCWQCGGKVESDNHRWCSKECIKKWELENEK